MGFQTFEGEPIYRPYLTRHDTSMLLSKLEEKYINGFKYTNIDEIKEILFFMYSTRYDQLKEIFSKCNSKDIIEIALYQYDKRDKITNTDKGKQKYIQKSIIELSLQYGLVDYQEYPNKEDVNSIFCIMEEIFHCINSLNRIKFEKIGWYIQFDFSKTLGTEFISLSYDESFENYLKEENSKKVSIGEIFHEYDAKRIENSRKILNEAFIDYFGFTWESYFSVLSAFGNKNSKIKFISKSPLGVSIYNKSDIVAVCNDIGLKDEQTKNLFDVIEISSENIGNRELRSMNHENRLYDRFLIKSKYQGKECYLRSGSMAYEALNFFIKNHNIGRKLRWMSDKIKKNIDIISNNYGKDFENHHNDILKNLGYKGKSYRDKYHFNNNLELSCLEIDWLGINSKGDTVVLLEYKTHKSSYGYDQYFAEYQSFLIDTDNKGKTKQSYNSKFNKKIKFVISNFEAIKKNISKEYNIDESKIGKFSFVMVTLNSLIAKYYTKDFEVISSYDFLEGLKKGRNHNTREIKYLSQ